MLMVINVKRSPYLRNAVNAICCSVKYLEPVAFMPGNKNVNQKSLFREGAGGGGETQALVYICTNNGSFPITP